MDKFEMQRYLEDKLDKILEGYFESLEDYIFEDACDLEDIFKFADDVFFYKEWSKGKKYKANIFLTEVRDEKYEKEGEEISD